MTKPPPKGVITSIVVGMILYSSNSLSQSIPPPKIVTPNAASIEKFGSIPVSFYSGIPNISIPVHAVLFGKMTVPIELNYHPASVRPTQIPGWVGQGWRIQSGGCITREIRYSIDEFYLPTTDGGDAPYYPHPVLSTYSGGQYPYLSNWSDTNRLKFYFHTKLDGSNGTTPPYLDVLGDEFTFNFSGHTGKFYYAGPANGWKVISDEDIKLEFDSTADFTFKDSIWAELDKHPGWPDGLFESLGMANYQSRMFKQFVLITSDGTKYFFGGTDGIDFCWPMGPYAGANVTPLATTWQLKKIIDINGNETIFHYSHGYPIVNAYIEYRLDGVLPDSTVQSNYLSGGIQFPLYLDSISTLNENVSFSRSNPVCLKYNNPSIPFGASILTTTAIYGQELDTISVRRKIDNNLIKKFAFNYTHDTLKRLTLNWIREYDNQLTNYKQYTFVYDTTRGSLPNYVGNYTDHWGFYNDINILGAGPSQLFNKKLPDSTKILCELLRTLIYPTGGFTRFTWESNDFSQRVSINRQSLFDTSNFGGGVRIKKIQNFLSDSSLVGERRFIYKKNYSSAVNTDTLLSSGILNCRPQYRFIVSRHQIDYGTMQNLDNTSLNLFNEYGYKGLSGPIGYSEVAEIFKDGSYRKHFFTNYGSDLNNQTHFDKPAVSYTCWMPNEDVYMPTSTLEIERGKLIGTYDYGQNNVLLLKTNITYRSDTTRFNEYIPRIEYSHIYEPSSTGDVLLFAAACKWFVYDYYPIRKTETTYDQTGSNPIIQTIDFTYNSKKLVNLEQRINSKGDTIKTYHKYPFDYSDAVLNAMTNKHILSNIVTDSVVKNQSLQTKTRINYYSPFSGIFVPQSVQVQTKTGPLETRQQFYRYDIHGNPLELGSSRDMHQSFIWDYNASSVIAQAVNADSASIAYTSFEAESKGNWSFSGVPSSDLSSPSGKKAYVLNGTNDLTKSGLSSSEEYILSYWTKNSSAFAITGTISGYPLSEKTYNGWKYFEHRITGQSSVTITGSGSIDEIRMYPTKALMTTYTYVPLAGMTTQIDANSRIIFYEYDGFDRLYLIRDQNGNILKKVCYNYYGQVDTCSSNNGSIWYATGQMRCKSCPLNGSYTSDTLQVQQIDINPTSSTYNNTRWIDDGKSSSCAPASWENTDTTRCKINSYGYVTGEQERKQRDKNPCSSSYNQVRWIVVGIDTITCPPTSCNTSNCTGEGYKCVYGICEEGIKTYTSSIPNPDSVNSPWDDYICTYHYEYTDGSWSIDYEEYSGFDCTPPPPPPGD